ncbi:nucleobase:cation symporter-2 family protein [Thermoactinomyces sp. CICC 10523]|uniref:nucleobase:cation symporter-2 family protein n=1 Tax=Thermoactinomyces sp. CICC 10523 TaxID=2767428 RepID=UPI0018DCE0EB|nr:nucleobase:cation symporter-2 family protein [Thermoactinomyces sp. CICC 10523]MBH8599206.1 purine permease [Thermoactinomyces sp. CICC 10523]
MNNLGIWKTLFLGFQHVLAMYAGAVVVPLIVGSSLGMNQQDLAYLISIDLFTCGIASLLQVAGGRFLGVKLPIILGCTFTAVPPMVTIGKLEGLPAIYGSIIASGIIVMIVSQIFSKIVKWFPPVVIGSVVTTIGVSLIPVAMNNVAGGQGSQSFGKIENLGLAALTLAIVILLNRFFKGYIRSISVLIAMIIGTAVAWGLGIVDFTSVSKEKWFQLVEPFHFGLPQFHLSSILTMTLVAIVSMIESLGVFMALADLCEKKLSDYDVKKGFLAEGLAYVIGGMFNSFPYTSFSQNVGLVALSKIKSRSVIVSAGLILMVLGLLPKIAAITTVVPNAVLGGAMVPMFGMVITSGIRILSTVDFKQNENLLIVACSIGIGLGISVVPAVFKEIPESIRVIVDNGIVIGSLTAIILNLILNRKKETAQHVNTPQSTAETS